MAGAAVPILVGSAIGAATNRENRLKGALLGGALGGIGGTLTGFGSLANTANTAASLTPAAAGTTAGTATGSAITAGAGGSAAANTIPGAVGAFGQAVPVIPPAAPGIFATPAQVSAFQPLTYEQATATGMQRPYGTFESLLNPNIESSSMAPTFMEQLGSGASQVGQFAQQNPVLVGMAAQSAQQMMQQPQRQAQPPGLLRGTQMQVAAPQYQVGVPQVSLI
jgi:hypothetical protein